MRRVVVASFAIVAVGLLSTRPLRSDEKSSGSLLSSSSGQLHLRFTDDSSLIVSVRDENVTFVTDYGKLVIPVAHIQKLELGRRVPEDVAKAITAAIAKLGSEDFEERERASAELLKIGTKAYPELQAAAKSDDVEVKRRATDILDKLKGRIGPDATELRPYDIVWTANSKITGKVQNDVLQVRAVFGDAKINVADLRSLKSDAFIDRTDVKRPDALADPGTLVGYSGKFGTKLAITLTGHVNGSIYGTDVYTVDSQIATAAVHAGVIKTGQTGVVYVEVVQSPPNFAASTRNGVTSYAWDAYPPGSYKFTNRPSALLVPQTGNVAVRLVDGSVLELTSRDEKVTIVTDKGKIALVVSEIRKVSFASRLPNDVADKIAAAIRKLGSDNVKERDDATAELLGFGARAYPLLLSMTEKIAEPEAKTRAQNILAKLKETVPADLLEARDTDTIWTKDTKISGKFEVTEIQVKSTLLGDLKLRLADIESLRSAAADDGDKVPPKK